MTAYTKIEWDDHTFSPWVGEGKPIKITSASTWSKPKRWNDKAQRGGVRYRVLCSTPTDVFDSDVPSQWRFDLADLIIQTTSLDWLLLTTRIVNAAIMLDSMFPDGIPRNVWIGATICNQVDADRDIPKLLAVPAAKRFLSIEPMLGPVDLEQACDIAEAKICAGTWGTMAEPHRCVQAMRHGSVALLDWVIVGGESGPKARPMHPDWARSLRDQCQAAGVPFLFKQWGNWRPSVWFDGPDAESDAGGAFVDVDRTPHQFLANDGRTWDTNGGRYMYPPLPLGHWCLMLNEGKKAAGRLLDGREWNEVPQTGGSAS